MRSAVEHRECPEALAVIFPATLVKQIEERPDPRRSDPYFLKSTEVSEAVSEKPRQALPEPRPERHRKSLFGASQHLVRHFSPEDAPEEIFCLAALKAKPGGQTTCELDQRVI